MSTIFEYTVTCSLSPSEAAKGLMTPVKKMVGRAQQFKKCVKKAEGHLRRLGKENERERLPISVLFISLYIKLSPDVMAILFLAI